MKRLMSRQTFVRIKGRFLTPYSGPCREFSSIAAPASPFDYASLPLQSRKSRFPYGRCFHSTAASGLVSADPKLASSNTEEDSTMNEFLSRFVWIMRKKISQVYPNLDKATVDGMLLVIVDKVVDEIEKGGIEHTLGSSAAATALDFSEDLWKTVWEVSNRVLEDMNKERKKEKMKQFLQNEEVKEMCRFAGEVGIRGDLLRKLRFKWAREKMEESEFYRSLERLRGEDAAEGKLTSGSMKLKEEENGLAVVAEDSPKVGSLPKRKGKIMYRIYGLDFSDPKWAEVFKKVNESGEIIWPKEPKPISGKCKLILEKILSTDESDDPSSILAEWIQHLEPSRVDWKSLLDRLEQHNKGLYLKIGELLLSEKSFEADIRDYMKLIDAFVKENRLEDAERIHKKIGESGMEPDILTHCVLVDLYCKAGKLGLAKESFEKLKSCGFQSDTKMYSSMIMAYVKAGRPEEGLGLMRLMDTKEMALPLDMYMALLQSFAKLGNVKESKSIFNIMQFAGFQPTDESLTLLVEACSHTGDDLTARSYFDQMIKVGYKPNDVRTASMIRTYEKKNRLDKALDLLLELEKDGFEPGVATYSVLVDWLCRLQLVDESEQLLGKIAELGEAPSFKIHVSLCDMYSRVRDEKKALQSLGILEARKEELGKDDFSKIVEALGAGGFVEAAKRVCEMMQKQGFSIPPILASLQRTDSFSRRPRFSRRQAP